MTSLEIGKHYRFEGLVYRGLHSQLPSGTELGAPEEGGDDTFIVTGFWMDKLKTAGYDMDVACNSIFGNDLSYYGKDMDQFEVKIWDITDPTMRELHNDFRAIDYRTGLTCTLYPKRITNQGEVVGVEWFKNSDLTDKIIHVDVEYSRDVYGFAVSRITTRKWVMKNEEYHPKTKVTEKFYNINLEDQITEGKKRRANIVNTLTMPTFGALQAVLLPQGKSPTEVLLLGRKIMDQLDPFFQKFIGNSSTITDINDPNVGRKTIAVEIERMANNEYAFFKDPVSIFGGASIEQYLVAQFSI